MNMEIWIVQYHDNSWGAQESSDEIIGVYDSEEAAYKRAEEFESKYACSDDIVSVQCYELNEKVTTYNEDMDEESSD
jgi:hypothetical protein